MNTQPEPEPPQPELMSKTKYRVMIGVMFLAALYGPFDTYRKTGQITGITIGAAVFAFLLGVAIVSTVRWHANRPEK